MQYLRISNNLFKLFIYCTLNSLMAFTKYLVFSRIAVRCCKRKKSEVYKKKCVLSRTLL